MKESLNGPRHSVDQLLDARKFIPEVEALEKREEYYKITLEAEKKHHEEWGKMILQERDKLKEQSDALELLYDGKAFCLDEALKTLKDAESRLREAQTVIKTIANCLDREMGKEWWRQEDFEASDGESGDAFNVSTVSARVIREYEKALGGSESPSPATCKETVK